MGILDGIVSWIAEQVMNILDMISSSVLGALGCNMDTFLRYFPAAESDDYLLYLVDRMYKIFNNRLDSIIQSWQTKEPIEICNDCMLVVCICDIMNVLDNNEATIFSEKDLEKWLEKPENIVDDLCNEIINRNCDSYNEMLTSYINRGMED